MSAAAGKQLAGIRDEADLDPADAMLRVAVRGRTTGALGSVKVPVPPATLR